MVDCSGIEAFLQDRYKDWPEGQKQFVGTGKRIENLIEECFWPTDRIKAEVSKHLSSVFHDSYEGMIVEGPIEVWTFCPHHLVPCKFTVDLGYVSSGMVLGLSKLARVADALARRPIMQETYCSALADGLYSGFTCKGVGVRVVGEHGCMKCRGIKQSRTNVTTTELRGCFIKEDSCRAEFYSIINSRSRNG